MIQVYFAETWGSDNEEDLQALGRAEIRQFKLPGRLVDLRRVSCNDSSLFAQVWGTRHVMSANDSPITDGRWQYGELRWPGIPNVVTRESAPRIFPHDYVYVSDAVLGEYESKPEYQIIPEAGSVDYRRQWCVGHCRRVGRDLILLEVRKLYEGCRPDVVHLWHKYAVNPPRQSISALSAQPNVATRSKRIVYGLIKLGEKLATLAHRIMRPSSTAKQFVRLERGRADYNGWWNEPSVTPITWHITVSMTEPQFLERCKYLNNLVVEGLEERPLRELAIRLGNKASAIKALRSLKLLECILKRVAFTKQTGLDLRRDRKAINQRLRTESISSPASPLSILNDLRISGSHHGSKITIGDAVERLGITKHAHTATLGLVLDDVYDVVANTLERTAQVLE